MVLVTGEGSHQLTAQEIGQFGRLGLQPVVFVLNNSGYLIERIISKLPSARYNARSTNAGVYIEVVTGMWDAPPLAEQFSSHPASERG